jgi:hypothetical protein
MNRSGLPSGEHTVARICGPGSPLAVLRGSSVPLAEVPKEKHAMADKTGSCLCGAVAFEITGPLRPVIACHCHQCRKQTGTYMSSTAVKDEQFRLTETRGLNGTAQAIRGGEDSASNAVRCCSGKVTGTTTLQLPPARSMGSSASLLRATFSATAPGTTIRSPAGDSRHLDCTRSPRHLGGS